MADRYEDARGVIQDILGPVDAVTRISTRQGCVRGNHIHHQTVQWTFVLSGKLLIKTQAPGGPPQIHIYLPGEMACEQPGIAHAWRALEDTEVLVFTRGPRSGENYASDTERLAVRLL